MVWLRNKEQSIRFWVIHIPGLWLRVVAGGLMWFCLVRLPARAYVRAETLLTTGWAKKNEATLHFREYPVIHSPKYLAICKR